MYVIEWGVVIGGGDRRIFAASLSETTHWSLFAIKASTTWKYGLP